MYIGAGDACRQHGRYDQAIAFYQRVLALPKTYSQINGKRQENPLLQRNRRRAQTGIDSIETFETLDVSRIQDGTYTGTTLAYVGDLTVAVTVKSGRTTSVRITRHKDKQYFAALTDTPISNRRAAEFAGIDATTGATAKALAKKEE